MWRGRNEVSIAALLRKVFLCIALGGHPLFGVGMSKEKIEELLHAMNQTRVEVSVSDSDEKSFIEPIEHVSGSNES